MNEQINKKEDEAPFFMQAFITVLFVFALAYGIFSAVSFMCGYTESGYREKGYSSSGCYKPRTRFNVVFPAYHLGCRFGDWMSEPVE